MSKQPIKHEIELEKAIASKAEIAFTVPEHWKHNEVNRTQDA